MPRWTKSITVRAALIIFSISSVCFALIIILLNILSVNTYKEQAINSAEKTLSLQASNIDTKLETVIDFQNMLVMDKESVLQEDSAQTYLDRYSEYYPENTVTLLIRGNELVAISKRELTFSIPSDTSIYITSARDNRTILSSVYYSPYLAQRAIALIRTIRNDDSEPIMIVTEIATSGLFSNLIQHMETYETLVVLSETGETIYIDPSTDLYKKQRGSTALLEPIESLRDTLIKSKTGTHTVRLNNYDLLIYKSYTTQGWLLSVLIDEAMFFQSMSKMQVQYIFIAVISIIIITSISVLSSHMVLLPIKKLASQIDAITENEALAQKYIEQKKPITANDEIGKFINSFERLLIRLDQSKREQLATENQRFTLEYEVLQAQIQPHFLFNAHMCVQSMLEQNNIDDALVYLSALDDLLRASIHSAEFITLESELYFTKQYVKLQNMNKNRNVVLEIVGWEEYRNVLMPRLLIQPLIENSILHGFIGAGENSRIAIQISEESDLLHIIIEDNGCGMSPETIDSLEKDEGNGRRDGFVSIGIANLRKRISIYYNSECGLYVYSRLGFGTIVELVIAKEPQKKHMQQKV